jgi:hypothetical protein
MIDSGLREIPYFKQCVTRLREAVANGHTRRRIEFRAKIYASVLRCDWRELIAFAKKSKSGLRETSPNAIEAGAAKLKMLKAAEGLSAIVDRGLIAQITAAISERRRQRTP